MKNLKAKLEAIKIKLATTKIKKKYLVIIVPVALVITFLLSQLLINLPSILKPFEEISTEFILLKIFTGRDKDSIKISEFPEPRTETNPINGNFITARDLERLRNRKPFAVTLNNHPDSRPQSGLTEADIVMEVLTEGGITRYVAVFYENEPEKIGPVRSLRRYMIDFLAEFDSPVILHEGWAAFNESDPVYVRETDARQDVFEFNMKTMQSAASRYRDPVKSAESGYVHSLYTSHELIAKDFAKVASSFDWESTTEIEELKWKIEDSFENRGDAGRVDISFFSDYDNISRMAFEYNKDTNSYDRFIIDNEDFDEGNDQRVSPKNVILEWHDYRLANDGYARIIIDMIEEGEVQILRDGKVINGTWKKESRTARTRYYDEEGKEIELNRGQIWKVILNKSGNQKFSTVKYSNESL